MKPEARPIPVLETVPSPRTFCEDSLDFSLRMKLLSIFLSLWKSKKLIGVGVVVYLID